MTPRSWTCSSLTRKVGPLVAYHLSEKHTVSLQAVARAQDMSFSKCMRKFAEVLGRLIRTGLAIQDSKDKNFIDDLGFIQ